MATGHINGVFQQLRRVLQDSTDLTDGQLLEHFIGQRDQAAFATLVRRHGPMVWGVCRRVLTNHHDVEDAFQATFLVFVRRAASIASRDLLANWLYGVAHQTSLKARATAAKRKQRERQGTEMPEPATIEPHQTRDWEPLLDEELSRLPDKHRSVIVLCDLEGKTRKETAQQLGCAEGTVASRLARARALLAKRLTKRGVLLSGAALAAVLIQESASAAVPNTVVNSTINAVALAAVGRAAATGAVSVKVAALTEGVLKSMLMAKLKTAVMILFLVAMIGFGGGLFRHSTAAARPDDDMPRDANAPQKQDQPKSQKDLEALQGTWYVKAMEEGGKPQPKARFEDVEMQLVVEGDKLSILTMTPDGRVVGQQGLAFTLDEKASPKRLDVSKGGTTLLAVYAFEKGQLKLCIDLEGKSRPTSFKTVAGTQQRSYILQKKSAPAKLGQADEKPAAEKPVEPATKPEKEKETVTAWGKEADSMQVGIRFGKDRVYKVGETLTLIVRLRNNGKKDLPFFYDAEYFQKNPPLITNAAGKPVKIKERNIFGIIERSSLAPGKEVDLCILTLDFRPDADRKKDETWTLYGTGKFCIQYKDVPVVGEPLQAPTAVHATGKLELEVKADPPPA